MNSEIVLNNVGLQFELHHNKSSSLKEMFADLFSRTHQKKNDTFLALNNINLKLTTVID